LGNYAYGNPVGIRAHMLSSSHSDQGVYSEFPPTATTRSLFPNMADFERLGPASEPRNGTGQYAISSTSYAFLLGAIRFIESLQSILCAAIILLRT
jgi:hypothetical protein